MNEIKRLQAALDESQVALARAKVREVKLVEALERSFEWKLGGYDGPDYLENAKNSTWRLDGLILVKVAGILPPKNMFSAIKIMPSKKKRKAKKKPK